MLSCLDLSSNIIDQMEFIMNMATQSWNSSKATSFEKIQFETFLKLRIILCTYTIQHWADHVSYSSKGLISVHIAYFESIRLARIPRQAQIYFSNQSQAIKFLYDARHT